MNKKDASKILNKLVIWLSIIVIISLAILIPTISSSININTQRLIVKAVAAVDALSCTGLLGYAIVKLYRPLSKDTKKKLRPLIICIINIFVTTLLVASAIEWIESNTHYTFSCADTIIIGTLLVLVINFRLIFEIANVGKMMFNGGGSSDESELNKNQSKETSQ